MFEDGMYSDAEDEVEVEVEADAGEMATKEESLPDSGQAAPLEVAASFFFLSFSRTTLLLFSRPSSSFYLHPPSFPFGSRRALLRRRIFQVQRKGWRTGWAAKVLGQ